MITWKCLYKLDTEELAGILNDINNGESYTVDIIKYATICGLI